MAVWCSRAVAPRAAPVSSPKISGGLPPLGTGAQLQKRVRIRQPAEFKQAFAKGFRITRTPLAAVCRPNDSAEGARLGLAIARKAAPRAVDRNRVKRLIRENFRHNRQRLPAVDLVFYGMPGLHALDKQQLRATLAEIWLKVIDRCGGYKPSLSDSSAPTSAS